jgi:hypothetical protein
VTLLTGDICTPFFANITKAKTAKVVRMVWIHLRARDL